MLLGAPIGNVTFCEQYTGTKRVDASKPLLSAIAGLPDPQTGLLLLRPCVSHCHMVFSSRVTPPSLVHHALQNFDGEVRACLEAMCTGPLSAASVLAMAEPCRALDLHYDFNAFDEVLPAYNNAVLPGDRVPACQAGDSWTWAGGFPRTPATAATARRSGCTPRRLQHLGYTWRQTSSRSCACVFASQGPPLTQPAPCAMASWTGWATIPGPARVVETTSPPAVRPCCERGAEVAEVVLDVAQQTYGCLAGGCMAPQRLTLQSPARFGPGTSLQLLPRAPGLPLTTSPTSGATLARRLCARPPVPLVAEGCGGGWGPAAVKAWKGLGQALAVQSGEEAGTETDRLYQAVAVALQRENARDGWGRKACPRSLSVLRVGGPRVGGAGELTCVAMSSFRGSRSARAGFGPGTRRLAKARGAGRGILRYARICQMRTIRRSSGQRGHLERGHATVASVHV